MMLPNLGARTRTEHVVCACPTLRERNEREGRPSFRILRLLLGYSGSEIAEQAPGRQLVPVSASRHRISVRKLFVRAPSKLCSHKQPFHKRSRSHGHKDDDYSARCTSSLTVKGKWVSECAASRHESALQSE